MMVFLFVAGSYGLLLLHLPKFYNSLHNYHLLMKPMKMNKRQVSCLNDNLKKA
jgi:hypothetical protein